MLDIRIAIILSVLTRCLTYDYPNDFKISLSNDSMSISPYPVDFGSNRMSSRERESLGSDPDVGLGPVELLESRGFRVETHYPKTPDNYILTSFRIVNPFVRRKGKPVMLQHGYEASSTCFLWQPGGDATQPKDPRNVKRGTILNGNLGYELANHGYDVWLTNFRGTRFATNHTHLNPGRSGPYWEFSINELSQFDIPTHFRYIQKRTGHQKIAFIGHSLGTTAMFATLVSHKEINEQAQPVIMLAPSTRTTGAATMSAIPKYANPLTTTALRYVPASLAPHTSITGRALTMGCAGSNNPLQPLCLIMLGMLVGFDTAQLNTTRMPVYLSNAPEGTSTWVYDHFILNAVYNKLTMFDFGPIGNVAKYGSIVPPFFDLSKITNNYLAFFYGRNDWVADYQDTLWTKRQLSVPLFVDYVLPLKKWNHLDFIWAMDLGKYITPQVIRTLVKAGVYQ